MSHDVIKNKVLVTLLLCFSSISVSLLAVNPAFSADVTERSSTPPAFLQKPDYFLSFDKWRLSLKRMKKIKEWGKKMKAIIVVYGSDLLLHRLLALLSLISAQDSLETTVHFDMRNSSHTHPHRHNCTFQGLWWLLVWHWEQEWHHEAGGGKHPWLVDSWGCQESGCQCWWSTVCCKSPAQRRLKQVSAAHSLQRLNKHVEDCWDWLEHVGLLCLFEQRQLTSQILFKRQPGLVQLVGYRKYMVERCLGCKVKETWGRLLFCLFFPI